MSLDEIFSYAKDHWATVSGAFSAFAMFVGFVIAVLYRHFVAKPIRATLFSLTFSPNGIWAYVNRIAHGQGDDRDINHLRDYFSRRYDNAYSKFNRLERDVMRLRQLEQYKVAEEIHTNALMLKNAIIFSLSDLSKMDPKSKEARDKAEGISKAMTEYNIKVSEIYDKLAPPLLGRSKSGHKG